jgi:prohibitin 2
MPTLLPSVSYNRFNWQSPAIKWAVGVLLALFFISRVLIVVPAGERVVVFNAFNGVEHRVLGEGMDMLLPFVETPVFYDVRTHTYTMSGMVDEGQKQGDDSVPALTADGQIVKIDISIRYHLLPSNVWKLHQTVGPDYIDKILRPESRTIVRNAIANYTVTEVYASKRQLIQDEMQAKMSHSLAKYHMVLDEVLLRNVTFSEVFANAIEQKQVAMQDFERMKYVLQKEESEKQRKIIEATGEAEAIRRRAEALKMNPLLVQYEYVQKLTPGVKAIITDQKTLMSLGNLFDDKK